ncbi:hypothetical protein L6452_09103 [Arctium lappa]|uniref:Uncharacterized protein n=1 Tax=Arctium lappa TaxID=4217 RepID=A0ACB9DJ22_ARCLA|nr:hypothetical protein L6452_09103 [Arctium lappa]
MQIEVFDHLACISEYIISAKFSDVSGEAWFSIFNEEAETLLGCSNDELAEMKAHEEGTNFRLQLDKAKWIPFLFRVLVAPTEYDNVKRQKLNVVAIAPVNFAGLASHQLDGTAMSNEFASLLTKHNSEVNDHDRYVAYTPSRESGWPDRFSEKMEIVNRNQDFDPLEQNILFNTKDNSWGTSCSFSLCIENNRLVSQSGLVL